MNTSKVLNVLSWVLVVLLAVLFLLAAAGKLMGGAGQMFENWGYPRWFATFIGITELAGAIGLLIPKTTKFAILGLSGIMIGAAYTHLSNGEGLAVLRPIIFAAVLWTVWFLRRYSFSSAVK
ncbi:MAG: DoxX family protein [Pyrinomonadaceae bacterium]